MKNNTIVIYHSKTGFTKRYAAWIAETLNCELCEINELSLKEVLQYDRIIFGSYLIAGRLSNFKPLKTILPELAKKDLRIFTVGASPASDKYTEDVVTANLPKEYRNIPLFYFRGGIDLTKYKYITRKFMKVLQKELHKKDESSEPVPEISDYTDKEAITPLIESLT